MQTPQSTHGDHFWELALSFYPVGVRDWTQLVRLSRKCFNLVSHHTNQKNSPAHCQLYFFFSEKNAYVVLNAYFEIVFWKVSSQKHSSRINVSSGTPVRACSYHNTYCFLRFCCWVFSFQKKLFYWKVSYNILVMFFPSLNSFHVFLTSLTTQIYVL